MYGESVYKCALGSERFISAFRSEMSPINMPLAASGRPTQFRCSIKCVHSAEHFVRNITSANACITFLSLQRNSVKLCVTSNDSGPELAGGRPEAEISFNWERRYYAGDFESF